MAVIPWPAGQTPYITPDQLYGQSGTITVTSWPVGVQWGTLPFTSGGTVSSVAQQAVLSNICSEATIRAEEIVNQPLRATLITEVIDGPHQWMTVQNTAPGLPGWYSGPQNGRIVCSRWPVWQVTAVQTCPNGTWPRVFTPVPAGNFEPERPPKALGSSSAPSGAGEGGQAVIVAPGWIDWSQGRHGWRVKVSYVSGWPHACLTQAGTASTTSLVVDDCTGWGPPVGTGQSPAVIGASGIIYDALGGGQEAISCIAASAAAGPGTLTLANPTSYAHSTIGVMVSAMPQTVIWASAELAGASALTRGATATTIQTTGGRQQTATPKLLDDMARMRLNALRRTI